MLITRTPLRISLMGGGTDVAAFYKKHAGAVVSFAINKFVYVSVNKKFDGTFRVSYSRTENVEMIDQIQHDIVRETLKAFKIQGGLEITSVSDIPGSGTGLGSSSAFTVGLIKALGHNTSPATLAERAYTIEFDECHHPVGKQDQYASAFGGINYLRFRSNNVTVDPIYPDQKWIKEFEKNSLLLWTGVTRDANEVLDRQRKSFENGANTEFGVHLSNLAVEFYFEFMQWITPKRIGEYLQEGWKIKKMFAQGISNPRIDAIYESAMKAGAYGGKLLGAGGGGFLFFLAPPYLHGKIEEATGLRRMSFNIEMEGSKVIHET